MKRVWESFIEEYGDNFEKYPITIILEAFWQYSYDNIKGYKTERCEEVFKKHDIDKSDLG